jgi:hypothetical protein
MERQDKETTLSIELYNDLKDTYLQNVRQQAKLLDEQFYYYTFRLDDFVRQSFHLHSLNYVPRYINATVPTNKQDFNYAMALIISLNKHLALTFQRSINDVDDFLNNRVTVKFKVEPAHRLPVKATYNQISALKNQLTSFARVKMGLMPPLAMVDYEEHSSFIRKQEYPDYWLITMKSGKDVFGNYIKLDGAVTPEEYYEVTFAKPHNA